MKRSRRRIWIVLIAAGIGAATLGSPTGLEAGQPPPTARKPRPIVDLQSIVDQTAAGVEGVVTDIRYDYSDEEGPWTRVILSGVQSQFDSAPTVLEIRHFGGPLPDGSLLVAAELPGFVPGKPYIVFLRNTAWNLSPVVGDLALRVETVGGTEVLVSSDGLAVMQIDRDGVVLGPALFGSPDLDGTPPKALRESLPVLAR